MAVRVHTNDASALTDSDLDEFASMGGSFGIGEVSKAKEDWVLITTARIDGKLRGFMFSTLERIGGTPGVRAVGEERAWGRRLAKRFECDSGYDEQAFVVKTNGQKGFIDFEALKPESV